MPKFNTSRIFYLATISIMATFASLALQPENSIAHADQLPSWAPDRACLEQFEAAGKNCSSQLGAESNSLSPSAQSARKQCIQAKLSQECKNQMSNAQNHVIQAIPPCTEASQRYMQTLRSTCGNPTKENEICYKKVQLEFAPKIEDACKGMR